jgi:hypothetical protein
MNIQEIPVVKCVGEEGYKFIVVRVINIENQQNKTIIRARQDCKYHRDILAWFKEQELGGTGLRSGCIGGGRICFDHENKTIKIWDYSGDFGKEPDRALTVAILQEAYQGYVVSEQTDW